MENDNSILNSIKENQKKFERYNNLKLKNLRLSISNDQVTDLLESIPLFFQINQVD